MVDLEEDLEDLEDLEEPEEDLEEIIKYLIKPLNYFVISL